ncbi:MAG: chorismate synthase [Schleiferiaceae bacterium]
MPGNTIGQSLVLTTYGESHGSQIGGILDGMPAGIDIDLDLVQQALDRRRPGQSHLTTERNEEDKVTFHSGLFEGKTTGTPIAFSIPNKDQRSKDYGQLKDVYRPSHADFTYDAKYGHRDYRGGGRSSARETACRVVAGALAAQLLPQVSVKAWVSAVGPIALQVPTSELDLARIDAHPTRCPHAETAEKMEAYIEQCRTEKDSTGGVITAVASGVPVGLGEPVFDKLQADLAKALMSINAVKGFEIGSGFAAAAMRGSAHNDAITEDFKTATNHAGGVVGGLSNGAPIEVRVAFKPVATIGKEQHTVDKDGNPTVLAAKGRHDPCVVPRAVPIVEAMIQLVLADHYLRNLKYTR